MTAGDHSIAISGGDTKYNEVYAFENGALRQITRQNDELIAQLDFFEGVDYVIFCGGNNGKRREGGKCEASFHHGQSKAIPAKLVKRIHGPRVCDPQQLAISRSSPKCISS